MDARILSGDNDFSKFMPSSCNNYIDTNNISNRFLCYKGLNGLPEKPAISINTQGFEISWDNLPLYDTIFCKIGKNDVSRLTVRSLYYASNCGNSTYGYNFNTTCTQQAPYAQKCFNCENLEPLSMFADWPKKLDRFMHRYSGGYSSSWILFPDGSKYESSRDETQLIDYFYPEMYLPYGLPNLKGESFIIIKDKEEYYKDIKSLTEQIFIETCQKAFDSSNIVYLNEYAINPSLFESISLSAAIVGLGWRIFRLLCSFILQRFLKDSGSLPLTQILFIKKQNNLITELEVQPITILSDPPLHQNEKQDIDQHGEETLQESTRAIP
jgi:hypothetical protein